jgi:nucleotide-binding universal stress UspA family protein
MKKIILAFDGVHFSEGAFEFARRLNELQPILLTGIFLPQAELANLWSYTDGMGVAFIPLLQDEEATEHVEKNIERFQKLCVGNGIDYRVHKDFYDFALPELRKESCYADLLILGSEVFYKSIGAEVPNDYIQDVLHHVACPVILVPEKFEFPDSIILAYDGSEDSVFAIKQFAYLFPELTGKKTVLVYAEDDETKDFPDKIQLEELATRHFSDLTLFKLEVDPKKHFGIWIADKKSSMLVCGAYGRSGVSQLFHKSFVKNIIAVHRLPVFIAHK